MILAHNHPTENPKPSKNIIDRLIEACNTFDVAVNDHLIIEKNSYTSIAKSGLL